MARPWLSLDVETSGNLPEYALQPHRVRQGKAWLTTLATSSRDASGAIKSNGLILYGRSADEVRSILESILRTARDERARILGWNTPFDCAWIMAHELIDLAMECQWLDGMQVWKHVDMEPSFVDGKSTMGGRGLKRAAQIFTNQGGYEVGVDYHDMSLGNLRKLLAYNIDDTELTLKITEGQWDLLDLRRRAVVLTEASAIPLVARANLEGMLVDEAAVEVLDTTLDQLRAQLHADMSKLGVTEDIVRSPAKLATLLFKKWGLPILKENPPTAAAIKKAEVAGIEPPPGKPSTDKEVLHELSIDYPNVEKLGKWRESMNLRNKFVTKLRDSIVYNGDGNVTRPNGVIFGTYTSRLTYASKQGRGQSMRQIGFALHQMKSDKRFRGMLIAPPDHDIVEFDAAGQEFRWMAIESEDETMLSLCLPDEDAHSYMTTQIRNEDYRAFLARVQAEDEPATKQRKLGKIANLSLQYRTSKRKLRVVARVQYGLPMTEDEAALIHSRYRLAYPGVPAYWKRQIMKGKNQGYIENLAGRRLQINGDWTGDHAFSMEQTTINYPIQGVGGDQKYLGLRIVRDELHRYDARFAWDLHDGMYFFVPKAKSLAFAHDIRTKLDNLPYRQAWGFTPPIPLPWDAKIGTTWGNLKGIA